MQSITFKKLLADRTYIAPKIQKYAIIAYALALVIGIVYVHYVLKTVRVDVLEKRQIKKVEDVYITSNVVRIYKLTSTAPKTFTSEEIRTVYADNLKNYDTVYDLLAYLRKKQRLTFEKTDYISKTEIHDVQNIALPPHYTWRIYNNGVDITNTINFTKLVGDQVYEIKPLLIT